MSRFIEFTDDELDLMEDAFCQYGVKYLVFEIREERRKREMESSGADMRGDTDADCD